jgi:hypothetical protein
MLYLIKSLEESYIRYLHDDPVRPHIPLEQRLGSNRIIFVETEQDQVQAITCVSLTNEVPAAEAELFTETVAPNVAVFYTIWSYNRGAARQLLFEAVEYLKQTHQNINRFITLSPKTDMAHQFHTKNGAVIFRENPDTVNYEYRV